MLTCDDDHGHTSQEAFTLDSDRMDDFLNEPSSQNYLGHRRRGMPDVYFPNVRGLDWCASHQIQGGDDGNRKNTATNNR